MKSVMISIQPEWCEKIAARWKTLELRKSKPNIPVPFKCYIYQTRFKWAFNLLRRLGMDDLADTLAIGFGNVVGEFVCDGILYNCEMANADFAEQQGLVRREKIREYSGGKQVFGWHISDLVIYEKPKRLSEFVVEGDCDCLNCKSCAWLDKGNGFNVEDDCNLAYQNAHRKKPLKPLFRPPQSWCYVEEVE